MHEFTQEEVQEKFDKLPKQVQDAITSTDVNDKILEIGRKYALLLDKIEELADETGLVMLGLEKSTDFVDHISSRCGVNKNAADNIVQDINIDIFSKIRDFMRESGKHKREDFTPPPKRTFPTFSALENAGKFEIEKGAGFTNLAEIPNYAAQKPAMPRTPSLRMPSPIVPPSTTSATPKIPDPLLNDASYQPFAKPRKINLLEDDSKLTKESVKNDMEASGIMIHDESKQEFMEHGDPAKQGLSAQHKVEPPANLPGEREVMGMTDEHTDALVDQLLGQVASAIQEKISKKPYIPPIPLAPGTGKDGYREPFV